MSSRLWLALPRFLWRGKWFWGAWLLIFLLPQTRHEARLHFLGSRFVRHLYGQPYQEDRLTPFEPTGDMMPLEAALWKQQKQLDSYSWSTGAVQNPRQTVAGQLSSKFPREKWLHAAALGSALGYDGSTLGLSVISWARAGEKLDPTNALYPLVMAQAKSEHAQPEDADAALHRAARCSVFDDGRRRLQLVWLHAARKAGVATWSEKSQALLNTRSYGNDPRDYFLGSVAESLGTQSGLDCAKGRYDSAINRSMAMMRVGLLLQSGTSDASMWSSGAIWARQAWKLSPSGKAPKKASIARRSWFGRPAKVSASAAAFDSFVRAHKRPDAGVLARQSAARVRLLAPYDLWNTPMWSPVPNNEPVLNSRESFWTMVAHPVGFGVLGYGFYLLSFWWLISAFLWGTHLPETPRRARVFAPVLVVLSSAAGLFFLMRFLSVWMTSPKFFARGPGTGQVEMFLFWGLITFFAPPLLLAWWSAVRTRRLHRAELALPARLELEMNLAPLESWVLTRATSAFFAAFLALSLGFAGIWLYLRLHNLVGYDWLRAVAPGVSSRTIDPIFTSLEMPTLPIYSALCLFLLLGVWIGAWRYTLDPARRVIFQGGLRTWKDLLGGAVTATVWVYLALLLALHVVGQGLEARTEIALSRGAGTFVRGF